MARCRSPPPPARTASPASAEAGDLRCRSASTWLLFTSATAEGLCWTLHLMSVYSFSFLESLLHSSYLCVLAGPCASKLPVFLWPVSRPLWRVRTTLASTEQTQPSQPAMSSQQSLHSQGHPAPPLHHPLHLPPPGVHRQQLLGTQAAGEHLAHHLASSAAAEGASHAHIEPPGPPAPRWLYDGDTCT